MCLHRRTNETRRYNNDDRADRIYQNKEAITVYKVLARNPNDKFISPFHDYEYEMGVLQPTTRSAKNFIAHNKDHTAISYKAYHAYLLKSHAKTTYEWASSRPYYKDGVVLVECVIPAWSGVAEGVDDNGDKCVVSNRIKAIKVINNPYNIGGY